LAIANRVVPKELQGQALIKQAQVLNEARQNTELVSELRDLLLKTDSSAGIDEENFSKLLTQTLETVQNYAQATTQISEKQSALLERVAGFADHFATAPMLETDIADINGLVALGENLNIV